MKYRPDVYQKAAIESILRKKRFALWLPMGLGKTSVVLHALAYLVDRLKVTQALVIAPKKVCELVWPNEIRKWDRTNWLTYELIKGNAVKRTKQLKSSAPIHIINYELLSWLVDNHALPHYEAIVIDESYRAKDPGAKRFRFLKRLCARATYVVELSGTPAAKGLQGLWSQIYLLDHGKALGSYYTSFLQRWFVSDFHGYTWTLRPGSQKDIHSRIEHLAMSMETKTLNWMPTVNRVFLPVELPNLDDYHKLAKEHLWEWGSDTVITAVNAGVLTGKLQQWANGHVYTQPGEDQYLITHDAKLDKLESVIEEAAGAPIIVYYWFRSDVDRIKKRFPQAVCGITSRTEREWNQGKIELLVLQLQSGSEGLNLQKGGNIVCFYSLSWSSTHIDQAIARLARKGQTKKVFAYFIIGQGTIDEKIIRVIEGDITIQEALLEHVRFYQ